MPTSARAVSLAKARPSTRAAASEALRADITKPRKELAQLGRAPRLHCRHASFMWRMPRASTIYGGLQLGALRGAAAGAGRARARLSAGLASSGGGFAGGAALGS